MNETAVLFGQDSPLLGIVGRPDCPTEPGDLPAVVFLNAGAVPRTGPNRVYVKLARKLTADGFLTLRFDFAGTGDSPGRPGETSLKATCLAGTHEAIDFMATTLDADRIILVGICLGADLALETAYEDPRVVGVVMINGYFLPDNADPEATAYLAKASGGRGYRKSMFSLRSWKRLLTGQTDLRSLWRFLVAKLKGPSARERDVLKTMASREKWLRLTERGVDLLLVYSERDRSLDTYMMTLKGVVESLASTGRITVSIVEGADHLFTMPSHRDTFMHRVRQWVVENRSA